MIKTDIFVLDPYNEKHIELCKQFEKENNLSCSISKYFEQIKKKYNKDEYNEILKKSNEKTTSLFITDGDKITDICIIKSENDRKTAYVTYPKLNKTRRKIIPVSISYLFNNLGIVEIFTSINKNDKILIRELESNQFESLGYDEDLIQFIKENDLEKNIEGSKTWK